MWGFAKYIFEEFIQKGGCRINDLYNVATLLFLRNYLRKSDIIDSWSLLYYIYYIDKIISDDEIWVNKWISIKIENNDKYVAQMYLHYSERSSSWFLLHIPQKSFSMQSEAIIWEISYNLTFNLF